MGEKEIKPATAAGGGVKIATDPNAPPPKQAGGGGTTERPGTGKTVTPQESDVKERPAKDPGPSKGWSGSDLYPDGYRMGREENGEFSLTNPDGSTATWDPGSETWKGADGKTMPEDWSSGHRPTKYETGPSTGS